MKKPIKVYEEDHKKIKCLFVNNARHDTMADGVKHIIERYEELVRPLELRSSLLPMQSEES